MLLKCPLARYFFFVGGVLLALLLMLGLVAAEVPDDGDGGHRRRQILSCGSIPIGNGRSASFSIPASGTDRTRADPQRCRKLSRPPRRKRGCRRFGQCARRICAARAILTRKNRSRSRSGNAKLQRNACWPRRACWSPNSRGSVFSSAISGKIGLLANLSEPATHTVSVFHNLSAGNWSPREQAVSKFVTPQRKMAPGQGGHPILLRLSDPLAVMMMMMMMAVVMMGWSACACALGIAKALNLAMAAKAKANFSHKNHSWAGFLSAQKMAKASAQVKRIFMNGRSGSAVIRASYCLRLDACEE